jgi:outer membrane protein TolC
VLAVPVFVSSPLFFASNASAEEGPAAPRISLQEAVKRSIERNPSAIIAEQEVRRAEALVREARSSSLPTLYGNGTYTHLDGDRTLNGNVVAGQDQLNANLLLTVPIVNPKAWANWSHSSDNVDVAKANHADTRRVVATNVARAYLAVITQKRVLEVSERARDAAKAHYEYAHQRFAGGVGNRIDEVRAAQELASDEAQVQLARSGVAKTREALGVVVGVDGPLDAMEDSGLAEPPPLAAALGDTTKRADIIALEHRAQAADHTVRDSWTDYSPYLTGLLQPFYQNPPTLTMPRTGWQAQLVLTLPLYDGGLRYGQKKEREVNAAEARATIDGTLRQAKADVRAAFVAMQRADDGLRAARDAAALAKQAFELAEIAYRAGATTNIEVIDAERRSRDADTSVAIAEDTARQARLDFLVASGRFP